MRGSRLVGLLSMIITRVSGWGVEEQEGSDNNKEKKTAVANARVAYISDSPGRSGRADLRFSSCGWWRERRRLFRGHYWTASFCHIRWGSRDRFHVRRGGTRRRRLRAELISPGMMAREPGIEM